MIQWVSLSMFDNVCEFGHCIETPAGIEGFFVGILILSAAGCNCGNDSILSLSVTTQCPTFWFVFAFFWVSLSRTTSKLVTPGPSGVFKGR